MTITHIVLFKYRPSIPWTDLQTHFAEFALLKTQCLKDSKPYMLSLKAGINTSWETHNKGMTHGFVLEFASQADLDYYLTEDKVHADFSAKALPLIEDSVVVDITDQVLFAPKATMPSKKTYDGSCHCGRVTWNVKLNNATHILCHCDTCKKLGGGPFSMNQIVHQDAFVLTQGALKTYTYKGASGKSVACYYCGNCTSHAYHQQEVMGDEIIVRTALLDGGSAMKVGGEIFPEGQLNWIKDLAGALPK